MTQYYRLGIPVVTCIRIKNWNYFLHVLHFLDWPQLSYRIVYERFLTHLFLRCIYRCRLCIFLRRIRIMTQLLLNLVVDIKFTVIFEEVELRRQLEIGEHCTVEMGLLIEYFFWLGRKKSWFSSFTLKLLLYWQRLNTRGEVFFVAIVFVSWWLFHVDLGCERIIKTDHRLRSSALEF